MSKEYWKDIDDRGRYQASNLGRVRSFCNYHNGVKEVPKILKPRLLNSGYEFVTILGRHKLVHKLVAMAFLSNPNSKPHVNHKDSDRRNNRVSNLEWCTRSENMMHASINGRLKKSRKEIERISKMKQGENHHNCKLGNDDILDIRGAYNIGCFTQNEIAEAYNVDQGLISKIINQKAWVHL